jgi:hypothetical protein
VLLLASFAVLLALQPAVAQPIRGATQVGAAAGEEICQSFADTQWLRYAAYFSVLLGGAGGGLIYSISRNRGAVIPHIVRRRTEEGVHTYVTLNLGFLAEILIGMGGGVIIFNLVPSNAQSDLFTSLLDSSCSWGTALSLLMKILALALIGGFAGISLFDEAAKRFNRELEEVRNQASSARGEVERLQHTAHQETELQYLLSSLIDPTLPPLSQGQEDKLLQLVVDAPLNLRNKVFERCQRAHSDQLLPMDGTALAPDQVNSRVSLQKQLLTAFDALIAAADEQERKGAGTDAQKHRYLAHRGFIHNQVAMGCELMGESSNALPHWRQAEDNLDLAIQLRDRSASDRNRFWHYNLDRMLARYRLGREQEVVEELQDRKIRTWIETQKDAGFVKANLRVLPADFLRFLASTIPELALESSPVPDGAAQVGGNGAADEPIGTLEQIRGRGSL